VAVHEQSRGDEQDQPHDAHQVFLLEVVDAEHHNGRETHAEQGRELQLVFESVVADLPAVRQLYFGLPKQKREEGEPNEHVQQQHQLVLEGLLLVSQYLFNVFEQLF